MPSGDISDPDPPARPTPVTPAVRYTAWALVTGQFALLAVIVIVPSGHDWPVPRGLAVAGLLGAGAGIVVMLAAATGLGRGLTATPLPNEHARLQTGGMYRLVRHPMYTGLLLFALGRAAGSGRTLVAVSVLLLIALLNLKARWEERRLSERFDAYPAYARRTARFIPGIR